jgi:hypothetical protein
MQFTRPKTTYPLLLFFLDNIIVWFKLSQILELEIEEEIKLYEKMMEGEFLWTSEGLVLKEPWFH